jgi:Golgi nucleoside diphosphatase
MIFPPKPKCDFYPRPHCTPFKIDPINIYAKGVVANLTFCLDKVSEELTDFSWSEIKIYLGATAGMRLLNSTNPEAATRIIEEAQKLNHATAYQIPDNAFKILTGSEEAEYGWISANVLAGNFENSNVGAVVNALDLGHNSQLIKNCSAAFPFS